jgi:hypothetical protein
MLNWTSCEINDVLQQHCIKLLMNFGKFRRDQMAKMAAHPQFGG